MLAFLFWSSGSAHTIVTGWLCACCEFLLSICDCIRRSSSCGRRGMQKCCCGNSAVERRWDYFYFVDVASNAPDYGSISRARWTRVHGGAGSWHERFISNTPFLELLQKDHVSSKRYIDVYLFTLRYTQCRSCLRYEGLPRGSLCRNRQRASIPRLRTINPRARRLMLMYAVMSSCSCHIVSNSTS
jgi:hypothetical protein